MKRTLLESIAIVCCLLTLGTGTTSAQLAGQVTGVVRDTTGMAVPGVAVTITGPTLAPRSVVTDEYGRYELDGLPVGRYLVTATFSGFEPRIIEHDVDAGRVTLNLVLDVSSFSERVTVAATKTGATDIQSTPMAITAVPERTIEELGIHSVGMLAGIVPSMTVAHSVAGHPLVTIRGIGTNAAGPGADPSSTTYLDGVYLGRPVMASPDLLNVERVEILRGPQGTLHGRNSVGGAIHIVTRQPTNTLEARVRLTAGNYGRLRAESAASGPLIKNKVMGNVAFVRSTSRGFVRDLDHLDHTLGSEDTWAARGQLRVVLGTRSELLLSSDYSRFAGVPLSWAKPIAAKPGFSFNNPTPLWDVRASHLASGENEQLGVSAKLTIQLNATTTLTSLTAYRKADNRLFLDVDATELNVMTSDAPDLQRQVSQELTVVRRTPKLTWIGGVFLFGDHNEGDAGATFPALGIRARIFPSIGSEAWAIFGQATYSLSNRISLTGGVRYTDEQKDLDNTGGVYRLGTAVLADPASFYDYADHTTSDAWTPKGSFQVLVSPDLFVYVSAARGFKAGGFNTSGRGPGKVFSPEFAWSYEGGLKRTIAGGRVRANTAVFYNDYHDLQVRSFIPPDQIDVSNAGAAVIRGIELEVAGAAGRGVQLAGNVSWLEATYDRYLARLPGGATLDAAGNRLNNAPAWSSSASAVYEFATGGAGTASMRGDVSWQSRVFFTPANDDVETQRAYGLLHLRAAFQPRSRRWEIAAYVRNAGNTEYITGTQNAAPTAVTGRPGDPRHWGTQLTIRR